MISIAQRMKQVAGHRRLFDEPAMFASVMARTVDDTLVSFQVELSIRKIKVTPRIFMLYGRMAQI